MTTQPTSPRADLSSLRISDQKRPSGRRGKRLWIVAALLAVVVLLTAASFAFRNQKPIVDVAMAQRATAERAALLNASGYVTPRRRATVAAKITGRVTGVFFDEGMHVKQGFSGHA